MVWTDLFINLGYTGVFLISLIGAASVFIPSPYTATYYILGTALNPLFIAIARGLGSALGELTGYAAGYFGQVFIDEKQKRKMFYLM
jgi:membrane protein YqaA with SNARE-associated domain